MEHISYTPKHVCSRKIDIDVEDGVITAVKFTSERKRRASGVFSPFQPFSEAIFLIGSIEETFTVLNFFAANSQRVSFPAPPLPFITIASFII